MAKLCAVCDKKISLLKEPQPGIYTHPGCEATFLQNPEKYGGKAIKKTKAQIRADWLGVARAKQQLKIEDKSVHVKSFDMPFGDMVGFMVKWALASIPAFIILAIIGAIFFAIFTAIFVSTR